MILLKRCLHESQRKTLWLSFVNPRKDKSSRSQMFFEIGVLKNLRIFTGHMCWDLFLIKLQAWWPATLFKRDSNCFPVNFLKFLRTPFFIEHFRRLLLEGVCEGISLVKILQSCHFSIFGINHRCFRKMPIKKNNEQPRLLKRLSFLLVNVSIEINNVSKYIEIKDN